MAASVNGSGDAFEVTKVEPLFTIAYPYGAYHAFDVTTDGRRFLANTLAVGQGPSLRARR